MSLVRQITSLEGGGGRNLESPVSQPVPIPPCLFLHCTSSLLSIALQLQVLRVTLHTSRILLLESPYIAGCRPFKGDVGLFTMAQGSTVNPGPDCSIPPCLTVSQISSIKWLKLAFNISMISWIKISSMSLKRTQYEWARQDQAFSCRLNFHN